MSTRSRIGVYDDQVVHWIYCHFDGYPEGVGETLLLHYTELEKIEKLMELGSLSILDRNIGEKIDFDDREARQQAQQCLAYHRDRDEGWGLTAPSHLLPDEENFESACKALADHHRLEQGWEEFLYLFDAEKGEWWMADVAHLWMAQRVPRTCKWIKLADHEKLKEVAVAAQA